MFQNSGFKKILVAKKKIPVPGNFSPARRTGPRVFRAKKNLPLGGGGLAVAETISVT